MGRTEAGSGWSRSVPTGLPRLLAVIAAAVALCWPALLNGQPFLHADSGSYVAGGERAVTMVLGERFATAWTRPAEAGGSGLDVTADNGEVGGGRSIYYALFTYVGEIAGGFWLSIVLQGLALAVLLDILVRRLGLPGIRAYAAVVAVVAALTPAPFFVSFLIPDIWAGLAIGAVAALFALFRRLTRSEIAALGAITSFAALAHNSVVLVLAGVAVAAALAAIALRRWREAMPAFAMTAGAVVIGVLGVVGFNLAVERAMGQPPLMPPFITAKIAADPPGLRYVRERCPEAGFEVCRYADRLPLLVDDFLWSSGSDTGVFKTASPESRRALSQEQVRFALAVAAAYPVEQAAVSLENAAAQLTALHMEDFRYEEIFRGSVLPRLAEPHRSRSLDTIAGRELWPLNRLLALHAAVILASVAGALAMLRRRSGVDLSNHQAALVFLGVAILGVAANAVACGALSALHGRYQARVIWLLPLAAMLLALVWTQAAERGRRLRLGALPLPRRAEVVR